MASLLSKGIAVTLEYTGMRGSLKVMFASTSSTAVRAELIRSVWNAPDTASGCAFSAPCVRSAHI
eukprot:320420-Pyramimonas_sp.AAC.1